MGQTLSQSSSIHISGNLTVSPERVKRVTVIVEENTLQVCWEDDDLTCGWLLSEVIRRFGEDGTMMPIVGLKSLHSHETLDFLLTNFDRPLSLIKNGTVLQAVCAESSPKSDRVGIDDFTIIKCIGKGGFSKVMQARKKDSGKMYAIKQISKRHIIKENKVSQILTERRILGQVHHPSIVNLHWAFQTEDYLHLVLDFCPGGELFFHLRKLGPFREYVAKFYFGLIVLGIEFLHAHHIIYRDLKPENVLMDLDGYVRLADFGLSKENVRDNYSAKSFCGSPEYMSPEMLLNQGHGKAVDWYSVGAFLYEMLTGLPPFYNENRNVMYQSILHDELNIPYYLSPDARSLLKGLLTRDPSKRLGSTVGAKDIKDHVWCKDIDWQGLLNKEVTPPFKPSLKAKNFDSEYTEMPVDEADPLLKVISKEEVSKYDFSDFNFHNKELHSRSIYSISPISSSFIAREDHSKLYAPVEIEGEDDILEIECDVATLTLHPSSVPGSATASTAPSLPSPESSTLVSPSSSVADFTPQISTVTISSSSALPSSNVSPTSRFPVPTPKGYVEAGGADVLEVVTTHYRPT